MSNESEYTPTEELLNSITHAIGTLLSIYGIVMLIYYSKTPLQTTSTAIFGATLIILFQSSTFYHAMVNKTAKNVFRRIDHSAIFILIAGTYTPILLLSMPYPHSIALLSMVWYLTIIGIVFSCITVKFKYVNTALYLIMGWLSVFLFWQIWMVSNRHVVILLLAGGLVYSLGSVAYLLKKVKYTHTIWHIMVLIAAILHYFAILELLKY